jgi:hypothetical protein
MPHLQKRRKYLKLSWNRQLAFSVIQKRHPRQIKQLPLYIPIIKRGASEMKPSTKRVYVKVTSVFDATGYMHPRTITWNDGREFEIEEVKDYRPAGTNRDSTTDCYTIIIRGDTKYLFFERTNRYQKSTVGRWYVECPQ